MIISLYHEHYEEEHLAEVTAEMVKRGAPVIRCIWAEAYGQWMAVEGCHRLRAAKALGLTPVVKDISQQRTVTIQIEGKNVTVKVAALTEELTDGLWRAYAIEFDD